MMLNAINIKLNPAIKVVLFNIELKDPFEHFT